jgi:DNA-binding LacI/PurR family transcriptional regulator
MNHDGVAARANADQEPVWERSAASERPPEPLGCNGTIDRNMVVSEDNGSNGHRPTLQDVAVRAEVSKSLVSLVMRGEPMVREEKRRRVLKAAEELGYQVRVKSRAPIEERSTSTVGVLVADLRNPLLVDVVEQAASALEDAGFTSVLTPLASPARSSFDRRLSIRMIDVLKDLRVRALLIVGSVSGRAALADVSSEFPVVVTAAHAEGLRADVVRNDDQLGMRLVVDYLVACGHRAIAHLGGLGGGTAQERLAGYCDAMQHHGLNSEIVTAEAEFTEDSGYRATAQLLRRGRRVTAITAVNDLAAVGTLSAAADAGLRVPGDLAVTGYGDTFLAAIRQVSLTSVNPDSAGMGALAARCLLQRIDAPDRDTEEHLLPPRLVTRFSSNVPAER